MTRQGNRSLMKKQENLQREKETALNNLADKSFKEMIIRMLTCKHACKHENGTEELKENFNTEKVLNKELSKPEKYNN